MTGALFLALIFIGGYLLLRSYNNKITIGKIINYSVAIFGVGIAISFIGAVIYGMRRGRPIVRNIQNVAVRFVDMTPDDLNLQVQGMLLEAVREGDRQLSSDEILARLKAVNTPQEGMCGVCYDELTLELLECPECHKAAHKSCLKEWLDSGQNVCIYCRENLIPA